MKTKLFLVLLFLCGMFVFPGWQALAKEDSQKIYPLRPSRIADYIEFTKGERRVILIYASWCPYCRAKIPDMMKMERKKKGSVIAVSEDQNYEALSKYIKTLKDIPFKAILSNPKGSDTLEKALSQYGVRKWDGYPTIILLDEENKAVRQGNFSSNRIARFLFNEK